MRNKRRKFIIEIGISLIIASFFLLISYVVMSDMTPLSSEKAKLQLFEAFRQYYWPKEESNMEDSVIMIDTHYDQEFVMEHKPVMGKMLPTGKIPATDRQKLLTCLEILKERNDYKYIMLDIFLEKSVSQESDSTLYKTIASMPRIVLAKPQDSPLADSCLRPKAGAVQYSIALWENDFVKYPYFFKGGKSLPLLMYEEITGNSVKSKGSFLWDRGIARRSVILTFENVDLNKRDYLGGVEDYSINNILSETKGKYILIGNFVDDMHNTYRGEVPGTLINFYAYLALLQGHHRLSCGIILFLLLIFAIPIYLKISNYKIFEWIRKKFRQTNFFSPIISVSKKFWTLMEKFRYIKTLLIFIFTIISKLFCSWVGYPLYLTIVCLFTYLIFNEAYDILVTTLLFYLFSIIWDSYHELKTKNK